MVDEVAQGGADMMLINPSGGIGRVNYPSRVWQTMWDKPKEEIIGGYMQMKHLSDSGCDYLACSLERCRKNGIGAGVSIRMNDAHATQWPDNPRHSDFFRQHTDWLLAAPYRPDGPYITSYTMDYRRTEVREYFLALIDEIITDYKPDALELDFMRWPLYFPPGEAIQFSSVMTEFIRQIRMMCGNSIFLMVRMPVTPAAAFDYGFDVAEWTREGLVNGIVVTAHFNTAWDIDMSAWQKVAGNKIALYAGAESSAYSPEGSREWVMGQDENLLRGFAAANYAKGADGVYLFNFFLTREWEGREPLFSAISQLRDPAYLQGKTKTYCITAAGGNWHLGESDGPLQLPRIAKKRVPQSFRIGIGKEPDGLAIELKIIIEGEQLTQKQRFHLHVNESSAGFASGTRIVQGINPDRPVRSIVFSAKSDVLRAGQNTIVFRNDGPTVNVLSVMVSIP